MAPDIHLQPQLQGSSNSWISLTGAWHQPLTSRACFSATTTMSIPSIPYLDLLAPEVWLDCWTPCSTRQLRRLSLVCHLFRTLCLPLLFRHQSLDVGQVWSPVDNDGWGDRLDYMERTAIRLERLMDGPRALWVRSWRFSAAPEAHPHTRLLLNIQNRKHFVLLEKLHEQIIATFASTLGLYHNLRSLHLQGVTIDMHTRNTLSSLSNLESLTLACEITARDGDLMKLKSFTIAVTPGASIAVTTEPLRIVSAEHLQNLNIDDRWEMASLLTGFQPRKFPQLVSISLDFLSDEERGIDLGIDLFFEFLQRCPQLESLAIHYVYFTSNDPLPSRLHPNTIPRLGSLTAPLNLIDLFTPNRPVGTVSVKRGYPYDHVAIPSEEAGEYLALLFAGLSLASIPLQFLSIPPISPTPECFAAIVSACPHLTALVIDVTETAAWPPRRGEIACPEEEISDAEDSEGMPRASSVDSSSSAAQYWILTTVLKWIREGSISLPPDLEVFRINLDSDVRPWISGEEEAQARASLIGLCPGLREVQIGPVHNQWKRTGAGWKKVRA
ncbi:hypothetical protein GGX14DRAFT_595926 [Mycena pura]|uniref:F-box domain-containing protein n=1 Tax=Mycena pura TaxID=153505 RepID=A0AAD6UTA2_9AGAR|nr:hypothetical protein GGX14DRAFT_595926 [Mycena pura]